MWQYPTVTPVCSPCMTADVEHFCVTWTLVVALKEMPIKSVLFISVGCLICYWFVRALNVHVCSLLGVTIANIFFHYETHIITVYGVF